MYCFIQYIRCMCVCVFVVVCVLKMCKCIICKLPGASTPGVKMGVECDFTCCHERMRSSQFTRNGDFSEKKSMRFGRGSGSVCISCICLLCCPFVT